MVAHRTLRTALDASLKAAHPRPQDAAAVRLARQYAEQLDAAAGRECDECDRSVDITRLGAVMLAVLDALGLTPAARAKQTGAAAAAAPPPASPLDELKGRRAARQGIVP
jgi:hypothetical protein